MATQSQGSTMTATRVEEKILQALRQFQQQPVTAQEISMHTGASPEQVKSILGQMSRNGQSGKLQKLGPDTFLYSKAPLPQVGKSFTGQVVGASYSGGSVIRDESGALWKVVPI